MYSRVFVCRISSLCVCARVPFVYKPSVTCSLSYRFLLRRLASKLRAAPMSSPPLPPLSKL